MTMKSLASAIALSTIAVAPAMSADKVELEMYYPIAVGGSLTEVVDSMVSDFERAHPDIEVNAIYSGNYDDTRVRAISAVDAGDPPPLSVMFSIDLYELVDRDVIIPFNEVVETEEEKAWLESFYPGLLANGKLGDDVYGIPFQRSTIVMYWNRELFEEAGLDPERPPESWEEMAEYAKTIRQQSEGERWGVMIPSTGYPYWMFQALAYQNGHQLMSADGTEVYFDDPAAIEALEYWVELNTEHEAMPSGTIDWGSLRQNFLEGETAMMWHSTGNLTAVRDDADFEFGTAMLPASTQPGSPTGGGNFYLFKDTSEEERRAALTFVKWMTGPEQSARWSMETGYMGVSPEAYETDQMKDYVEQFPQAAVARDQLEYSTAELSTYQGGRVRRALDDAVQAALTGDATPEQALKQAQRQAEAALRRYNR